MANKETKDKPHKSIEIYGVRGLKSRPFRRVFNSQRALERWLEKNGDDCEVYGYRELN